MLQYIHLSVFEFLVLFKMVFLPLYCTYWLSDLLKFLSLYKFLIHLKFNSVYCIRQRSNLTLFLTEISCTNICMKHFIYSCIKFWFSTLLYWLINPLCTKTHWLDFALVLKYLLLPSKAILQFFFIVLTVLSYIFLDYFKHVFFFHIKFLKILIKKIDQ